jgi:hypothetical protein
MAPTVESSGKHFELSSPIIPLNPPKQEAHVLIVSRQAFRWRAVQLGAAEQFTALIAEDTRLMV